MKILVTGATGRVGRFLVQQLAQQGHEVRALTRDAAMATFPAGVVPMSGDLTQPETLAPALDGVEALHLISATGSHYAPLLTGAEILALAEKAGVKRVTILKGVQSAALEKALQASSLAWTKVIPVEFMSGMADWAPGIRERGQVRQPFGDRKTAAVHEADIAAVFAAALTQDGHAGETYTVTGPEVLTPKVMAQTIGAMIGRNIQFVELSAEQAREEWTAAGLAADLIDFLLWVKGTPQPVGASVSPAVPQVTGKPGRTFAQWAAENADAFR